MTDQVKKNSTAASIDSFARPALHTKGTLGTLAQHVALQPRTFQQLVVELSSTHARELQELQTEIQALHEKLESCKAQPSPNGEEGHLSPYVDSNGEIRTADNGLTAGCSAHAETGHTSGDTKADDAILLSSSVQTGRVSVRGDWRESDFDEKMEALDRLDPLHSRKVRGTTGQEKQETIVSRSKTMTKSWTRNMATLLESTRFEMFISGLIFINTIIMALEMQFFGGIVGYELGYAGYDAHPKENMPSGEQIFSAVEKVFVVIFAIELVLKLCILQLAFFRVAFNWLDMMVVIAGLADWIGSASSALDPKMMRMLRLLKVARGLRALRSVSALDSLQLLIKSISASMSTLFWSLMVLCVIQCISGMVVSQLLNSYFDEAKKSNHGKVPPSAHEVFGYYGTFSRAMVTMFEVTLANWAKPCRVLINHVGEEYGFVILCYKCICGFAVLNVIGAVFIQQTMKVMGQDTDIMLMEKARVEIAFEKKMYKLFDILDVSCDGHITWDELQEKIDDPSVKQEAYFLGLDVSDLEDMYQLIDNPESMTVTDFVSAATRIRKQAKSIDIAHLLAHVRIIEKCLHMLQDQAVDSAEVLQKLTVHVEEISPAAATRSACATSSHGPIRLADIDAKVVDVDNGLCEATSPRSIQSAAISSI